MLAQQKIAIIIPLYNEAKNIGALINSLPSYIDELIVVNDGSTDASERIVQEYFEKEKSRSTIQTTNYHYLVHNINKGKGAALKSGYTFALNLDVSLIATIDGDGQMDVSELASLCLPVASNEVDYAKGERLTHPEAASIIPKTRLFGIQVLSFLTSAVSGYKNLKDAQSGYTVISKKVLSQIPIDELYDSYGCPNDMLVRLSILGASVKEFPITPIYHANAESKMVIYKVIPKISFLFLRLTLIKLASTIGLNALPSSKSQQK